MAENKELILMIQATTYTNDTNRTVARTDICCRQHAVYKTVKTSGTAEIAARRHTRAYPTF